MSDTEAPGSTRTIRIPGLIEGDPLTVEADVLEDLPGVIDALAEYLDEATVQLANTERTRILQARPSFSSEELAAAYEASTRANTIRRLRDAARAMCAHAADLEASAGTYTTDE